MICKRILPCAELTPLIREYLVAQFSFKDPGELPPLRVYPPNPEEGIRFLIRGKLVTNDPATGTSKETPSISLIGQPTARQNLQISHEYLMLYIRFQPGSLFRLLHIPMTMLTDQHIDATLVLGKEIGELYEQLGLCNAHDAMINILNLYFLKKQSGLKNDGQPVDRIGRMILQDPQGFDLEKTASDACLSYRQFEKDLSGQ